MTEQAGVDDALPLLESERRAGARHRRLARAREVLAIRRRLTRLGRDGLSTPRHRGTQPLPNAEREASGVVEGEVLVGILTVGDDPGWRGDKAERPQIAVGDLRQIVAHREPVRQAHRGAPGERAARDEMVDVAGELLVQQLLDNFGPVVGRVVAVSAERVERESVRVVAGRRVRDEIFRVRRVPAEQQVGDGREGEVSADHLPLLVVVGQHAVLVGSGSGHEIAQCITAAGNRHREAPLEGIAKPGINEEVARRSSGARYPAIGQAREPRGEAVPIGLGNRIAGRRGAWLRAERERARDAFIQLHGPLRLSGVPRFREDLDDARRGFGAVQGCRGGALDDLDPLDVVRVDVVQRARDVIAAAQVRAGGRDVPLITVAPEAHAIDIDQRLIAHRDADVAAQPNHRAAAGAGRALHHRHAGSASLKQLSHRLRRLLHLGQVDL